MTALGSGIGGVVWALSTNTPTPAEALGSPLTGFTDSVNSVAFSPKGHTLAAGSTDKTIRLWNATDPAHPVSLGSPLLTGIFTGGVNSVAFSPDGHTLVAGSADHTIRLWALR